MAHDNLFFKKLAVVHEKFHTPAFAIVALGVWSAVLTCAGKFSELIGGVIFIGWIFYGLGAAAIVGNAIYLAFRDPSQFKNLAVAIILFLIGLPAYFFWRKRAAS